MSKRKIIKNLLWVIIGAVFLIAGIPIIINECYKANCGYLTVWDGADMLGQNMAITPLTTFKDALTDVSFLAMR